jgi:hypothetical protein
LGEIRNSEPTRHGHGAAPDVMSGQHRLPLTPALADSDMLKGDSGTVAEARLPVPGGLVLSDRGAA